MNADGGKSAATGSTAPVVWVVLGALSLSMSATLIALAGTSSVTTAFYRCSLALLMLLPLLIREVRRHGLPDRRFVVMALLGGAFLGADYLLWNVSIGDVGPGIATVLVNMQIVLFPVVVRVITGTPLARRFVVAIPVLLVAVTLAGGVVGPAPEGGAPLRGTLLALAAALGYSGYLYFTRDCGVRSPEYLVAPVFLATFAAAAMAAITGLFTSGIEVDLAPRTWVCLVLVALFGQAVGWLLVGAALPRLAPALSSTLLLLQPIGAVLIGIIWLGDVPTPLQSAGCAIVLATVWVLTAGRARSKRPARRSEGDLALEAEREVEGAKS
ncbi:DMT family transporter [Saccharopolyspora sp. NPDC002578]